MGHVTSVLNHDALTWVFAVRYHSRVGHGGVLFVVTSRVTTPVLPFCNPSPVGLPGLDHLTTRNIIFSTTCYGDPLYTPSHFALIDNRLPDGVNTCSGTTSFPTSIPACTRCLHHLNCHATLSNGVRFYNPSRLRNCRRHLADSVCPTSCN